MRTKSHTKKPKKKKKKKKKKTTRKGYGFIAQPEGEDVFVHHTAIQMNGYRSLEEGQPVEFELTEGPKGLQAVEVKPATA